MADKGLKIFEECAAECKHLCPQKDSKMYTPSTIANSQTDEGC